MRTGITLPLSAGPRAHLVDDRPGRLYDLVSRHGRGKIGLEDGQLRLFLRHQVLAAALAELLNALAPAVGLFADHLEDAGIVQRGTLSHLGVLDASHHEADSNLTTLVAAANSVLQVLSKPVFEGHP
jgi:hypothetical protein